MIMWGIKILNDDNKEGIKWETACLTINQQVKSLLLKPIMVSLCLLYLSLAKISSSFPPLSPGMFWLRGSIIQGIFEELYPSNKLCFGLWSSSAVGRSNSFSKKPSGISFFLHFAMKVFFIFNHSVPVPGTIRGCHRVYRKCTKT